MKRLHLLLGAALALGGCEQLEGDPLGDEVASSSGKADSLSPQFVAPDWLLAPVAQGTWIDAKEKNPAGQTIVHAWIDGRVQNRRVAKRVFVEVAVRYDNGAVMRTLHPAWYKGSMGGGNEKWGVDTVEIYPDGGPGGAKLVGKALYRLRMQEDPDNDRVEQMVVTNWRTLYGQGEAKAPDADPWAPGWKSPASAAGPATRPEVSFMPFDDGGLVVAREIDRVIEAKKKDPAGRHTIHAAIFNINDSRITDRLIAAHQAGVEVRLLEEETKFRPAQTWQTEDDRLYQAGVPLLGVRYRGTGSLHVKFALLDGKKVATGSFNWEVGSSKENHENMVLTDEPDLVKAYAERFEVLAAQVQLGRSGANDPAAVRSVSFAPDEEPARIMGRLIDQARSKINVAMFTAKDIEYDENGQKTSLFRKLGAAVKRGVAVNLITDFGICEIHEYFGTVQPVDPPEDEWVESMGVHVVRADNRMGAYASMHHKFVVIDDEILVTGAFNWFYDAAYLNAEDQLVWRDKALAANYTGEFVDLLRRYDAEYKASAWPQGAVSFEVRNDRTQVGDTVVLIGDLPELGAWDPAKSVALDPKAWPIWKATVKLPIGVRASYKFAVRHSNGSVDWQGGDNRTLRVPTDGTAAVISAQY